MNGYIAISEGSIVLISRFQSIIREVNFNLNQSLSDLDVNFIDSEDEAYDKQIEVCPPEYQVTCVKWIIPREHYENR